MSEDGASAPKTDSKALDAKISGSESDPLIGVVFENRYEILLFFGKGASAAAYKAHDRLLQRDVALKIIHSYLLASQDAIQRFKNEASTSMSLEHPNIARVYKQGVAADGRLYIVMDCLEGESLAEQIARQGKLELEEFFDFFRHLIDALAYAHEKGVIHRDIKPNNIMIVRDDDQKHAVLVDFGVAKFLGEEGDQQSTRTGAMLGSSAYMSPEQCMGKSDVDQRSDIYSLGCVMLEALLGKSPFQGESALDVMYKHLNESIGQLGFLKELPDALGKIIRKCLEKDREKRYQKVSELQEEFMACCEMQDTIKRRWKLNKKEIIRQRSLTAIAIILAVTVLALAAYFWTDSLSKERFKQKKEEDSRAVDKTQKLLPPPEQAVVPLPEEELNQLAWRYEREFGQGAMVSIYLRWIEHYGKSADPSELAGVQASLASVYSRIDNMDKAEEYLQKIMQAKIYGAALIGAVTGTYHGFNRNHMQKKAIAMYDHLLKDFPCINESPERTFQIQGMRAGCFKELHQDRIAIAAFKSALKNPHLREISPVQVNQCRYDLITLLCRNGQKAEAKKIAEQCLSSSMSSTADNSQELQDQLFNLAQAFAAGDDLLDSIEWSKRLRQLFLKLKKFPEAIMFSKRISSYYRELELFQEAATEAKSMLEYSSGKDRITILSSLSVDNHCLNNHELALDYAKKAYTESSALLDEELTSKRALSESMLALEEPFLNAACRLRDEYACHQMWKESIGVLNAAIEKLKKYPGPLLESLYIQQASLLINAKHPLAESISLLEQASAVLQDPRFKQLVPDHYQAVIDERASHVYVIEADAYNSYAQYQKALDAGDKALEIALRSSPVSQHKILLIQMHRANDLYCLGRKAEAEKVYKECENLCQLLHEDYAIGNAEHLRQIALYKKSEQKYKEAEELLRRSLTGLKLRYGENSRYLSQYYYDLATVLHANADYAHCSEITEKGLANVKRNHNSPPILYQAFLYLNYDMAMRIPDFPRAEKAMKEAIAASLPTEYSKNYYHLSIVYANQGQTDKRIATLKEALEKIKNVDDPLSLCSFYLELGSIYANIKDRENAKKYLQKTIKTAPLIKSKQAQECTEFKLGSAYYYFGVSASLDGKPAEASRFFSRSADYFAKIAGSEVLANYKKSLEEGITAATAAHDDKLLQHLQARLQKLK